MKQYYFSDGQNQFGPISIEELKVKNITKETLIWCEGMENWAKAGEVEELKELFPNIPTPPSISEKKIVTPPPINPQPESAQTPQSQNVININNNTSPSQGGVYIENSNSMKSKGVAYLLWLLSIFGWLGFHRFYLGKIGTGILWILTGGLFGFGALIDLFTLGGKVDLYNTNQELATIRTATLANAMK